jgi:hypothetical protein
VRTKKIPITPKNSNLRLGDVLPRLRTRRPKLKVDLEIKEIYRLTKDLTDVLSCLGRCRDHAKDWPKELEYMYQELLLTAGVVASESKIIRVRLKKTEKSYFSPM